ncbi:conserved hypothetical protein [Leishmania major strain Friedlin]|uniref:Uncharacterized protein n=1 Tax=Leishmania major TaxID=5664 RepID=Q4Q966_LEIMA|nr:conserved hypothetical protein [Leishmania major strain Friedlin]CAG9576449.1 hypothetical_protein_-_conserved [Leishmania major strain Friedlin]CAJ05196.1 conserved hypothetical protein [Leishmania major strain Friedlin]|eukprot:XP_001684132.1 conserved hypothetical protein [Leishmania major strain Friedlin]
MSTVSPWMAQEKKRSVTPVHGVAANAADDVRSLPAQNQLLLDPQYNVDLLTFSHIRERMRQQQQQQTAAKAACSSPSQSTATEAPSRAPPKVTPDGTADRLHAPGHAAASGATAPLLPDEVLSEEDSDSSEYDRGLPMDLENDLGSFLTTAGRAFAQMKRNRQSLSSRKDKSAADIESLHPQQGEAATIHTAPSPAAVAAASGTAMEAGHATGGDGAPAEAPVMMSETHPSQCMRLTQEPTAVLERSKDEDIDVDPSISDAGVAGRVVVQRKDSFASSSAASSSSVAAGRRASDAAGESEDDYVGFEGGGVAVMAFLYEQTWMALVGGGPTPMGTPQCVQFIRDGELQHHLLMPDPVVRLFLDARLLFVVTTAELRMYTNPIEREWTCLRQSLPLSAAVASRYAFVAATADGANAPVRVWEKLPDFGTSPSSASAATAADAAEGGLRVTSFASLASRPGGQIGDRGTRTAAVSLPVIPVVVDYARSLVLLPAGEEGKGFALHRYVSGSEVRYTDPVRNAGMSSSASAPDTERAAEAQAHLLTGSTAVTTGRTTSFLHHIATQGTAHRNPLYNLALYVGWPSSIARLLSRDTQAGAGDQVGGLSSGGLVTLVAASSEYATRITLWMLQGSQHEMASPYKDYPSSPSADSAGAAAFVLLREFRVGVRLAAPQVVMASLPGVSRYIARGHAALAGTSGRACSGGAEAASSTGAILLANASLAGDTARSHGTATPASASGLFIAASSPPSSASHTGTMTSWATEAAAAVASSATGLAAVHHLQFVGNGAYLLCVHGADIISIFSTSARETEQEAKNVCRDRVAAEQNRYSRLSIVKGYLPQALSSRLEAYTRQAWSSCSGRLPSADPTFMPRWICAQRRDMPGAATTSTATVSTAAPTSVSASHGASSLGAVTATIEGNSSRGRQRFFQRLTSLVGSRPPAAASATLPSESAKTAGLPGTDEDEPSASVPSRGTNPASRSLFSRATASRRLKSSGAPLTFPTSPFGGQRPLAGGGVWGTPLTELPQCIQVWPSAPHAGTGASHPYTGAASTASSPRRPPIVLNCATCEGAFASIVLFAEEGELLTSQVVPYATL